MTTADDDEVQDPTFRAPVPIEVRRAAQAARARAELVLAQSIAVREESRALHAQIHARRHRSVG